MFLPAQRTLNTSLSLTRDEYLEQQDQVIMVVSEPPPSHSF
jgi:hypothetical protein